MLRHVLPGVLITGGYFVHNPDLFPWITGDLTTQRIIIAGVTCMAIGNFFYVINRYGLLAILEWIYFRCCRCCVATPVSSLLRDYAKLVGTEVLIFYGYDSEDNHPYDAKAEFRKSSIKQLVQLIRWRDSAAVYLLIGGQAALIAAVDTKGILDFWMWDACGHQISRPWLFVAITSWLCGIFLYATNRFIVRECLGRTLSKSNVEWPSTESSLGKSPVRPPSSSADG